MKNNLEKVVILGSGWLGRELSTNLQKIGVITQETCRSNKLADEKIIHYFNVNNKCELEHNVNLEGAYWVSCITPKDNYIESLQQAIYLAKKLKMKGFLLCSSTGIYPSECGQYNELSELTLATERQKLLSRAEQTIMQLLDLGKVVRLAGLIGPKRHPGRFLSGKNLKMSSLATVNMVHQKDVVNGIISLLQQWKTPEQIFNLVSPDHPTKADFYQQACLMLEEITPSFESNEDETRIIDGSKITQLRFEYQYYSLFQALADC
ncbi:hypothetical protein CJF42_21870 [Pseudoalteromonas sp. NBT06-2]|uniref:NADP-binding protein n=1 Tax=Pseudoalteromonas sp. NBT06-2 TaxID=2025950 RepID=UPI000BA5B929|nr:NADP-binding protein [Pseudoalteromonas sp. NBT06-2]PAJ72313.1 hypothetical protein CJF42_21870 [Pseudoalteromonas sp. NBT06-2]